MDAVKMSKFTDHIRQQLAIFEVKKRPEDIRYEKFLEIDKRLYVSDEADAKTLGLSIEEYNALFGADSPGLPEEHRWIFPNFINVDSRTSTRKKINVIKPKNEAEKDQQENWVFYANYKSRCIIEHCFDLVDGVCHCNIKKEPQPFAAPASPLPGDGGFPDVEGHDGH